MIWIGDFVNLGCRFLFLYRSAAGVLVSDAKGRDVKIDSYTLSFHGRLLIEGAEVSLNYGQRYGLLGENGSGRVSTLITSPFVLFNVNLISLILSQLSFNPSPNVISQSQNISISTSFVVKPNLPTSTRSISSLHLQKKK